MLATMDPVVKAKWVLETMGIHDIPASHLNKIAQSENIYVLRRSLPSEKCLSGTLVYRGDKKGILINIYIDNTGRHNFTFAHELGHYFLQHKPTYISDGESGFRCSTQDIESDNGQLSKEVEANRFATELLMPEVLFKPFTAGSLFDFTLIGSLANQFYVSKQASGNRILDFIREPYVLICTRGLKITAMKCSRAAKAYSIAHYTIPSGTSTYDAIAGKHNQGGFSLVDASRWLNYCGSGTRVYEWTRGDYAHNVAMTILKIE
jgi:Zn-dependent peptidase ImmA (M78 family)